MSLIPSVPFLIYSHVYGTRKSFPVYGVFTIDPGETGDIDIPSSPGV